MLQLRPNCERCNTVLPPQAEAFVCAFECTFCADCVHGPLAGICPNCGGTLAPRAKGMSGSTDPYPPRNSEQGP